MGLCVCPRSWLREALLKCFSDVSSGPGVTRHGAHLVSMGLSGAVWMNGGRILHSCEGYHGQVVGMAYSLPHPLSPLPILCTFWSPYVTMVIFTRGAIPGRALEAWSWVNNSLSFHSVFSVLL